MILLLVIQHTYPLKYNMIINFFKKLLYAIMLYLKQFMSKNEKEIFDENHNYDYVSYTEDEEEANINETDYSLKYLTFVALEDGMFSWSGFSNAEYEVDNKISYSLDEGETWSEPQTIVDLQVHAGDRVMWKGDEMQTLNEGMLFVNGVGIFRASTCQFDVEGNIMSLIHGDDFQTNSQLTGDFMFMELFKDTKVVNAQNLVLPSMTMKMMCYSNMFDNCIYLLTSPLILPTIVFNPNPSSMGMETLGCYSYMFNGCTNLKTTPILPATALTENCYQYMFQDCISLLKAPELNATLVSPQAYYKMFQGCTKLKWIKMLGTNLKTNALKDFTNGVAAQGLFIKSANAQLETGINGIPNDWEVENV